VKAVPTQLQIAINCLDYSAPVSAVIALLMLIVTKAPSDFSGSIAKTLLRLDDI
jgi:hypothetical protein